MASTQQDYDWATQVEVQRLSAEEWVLQPEGSHDDALRMMRSAAALEDKTEKHPVTPGPVLPARELLADMLMELDHPELAVPEFEAVLRSAPKRFNSLYGSARASAPHCHQGAVHSGRSTVTLPPVPGDTARA